ncbi:MAG: DNA alkylation repair protein, partial [bacterium]
IDRRDQIIHGTFKALDEPTLERLGTGNADWATVDAFACEIAGPAWVAGRLSDKRVLRWANSKDLWWRRTALAASTSLNKSSHGGQGDTRRTLMVCTPNVADREDMIVKALSWALRELTKFDAPAVEQFLKQHEDVLAARVKREVATKLRTGLKNPKRA